jgi:hypothetical protein
MQLTIATVAGNAGKGLSVIPYLVIQSYVATGTILVGFVVLDYANTCENKP